LPNTCSISVWSCVTWNIGQKYAEGITIAIVCKHQLGFLSTRRVIPLGQQERKERETERKGQTAHLNLIILMQSLNLGLISLRQAQWKVTYIHNVHIHTREKPCSERKYEWISHTKLWWTYMYIMGKFM